MIGILLVSWNGYALLFQRLVVALNQMVEYVWNLAVGRAGVNPVTPLYLPQFNTVNGVFTSE